MEERLQGATREELIHHICTQRRLIRHLHRHVVILEQALSDFYSQGSNQTAEATSVVDILQPLTPPPETSSRGIAEIDRVVRAHAAGEMHLPIQTVAELLFIRRELGSLGSSEGVTRHHEGSPTHMTPSSGIKHPDDSGVAPSTIDGETCVFGTPEQRTVGVPWRGSPPASLVKLTRRRLLLDA